MKSQAIIDPASLSATVDAVSETITAGENLSVRDRTRVGRWIAARQGLPGAYADTFAGFEGERRHGIRLFTGERVTSASARHILGEEACRVLYQLNLRDKVVEGALGRATEGLQRCLARAAADPRQTNPGVFCCGKCTVGLWRHLVAAAGAGSGIDRREERLKKGIGFLRGRRDDEGGWRAFPFWYTVLLLSEMDLPGAKAELRYAAPNLESHAKRSATTKYGLRRRSIALRVLGRT